MANPPPKPTTTPSTTEDITGDLTVDELEVLEPHKHAEPPKPPPRSMRPGTTPPPAIPSRPSSSQSKSTSTSGSGSTSGSSSGAGASSKKLEAPPKSLPPDSKKREPTPSRAPQAAVQSRTPLPSPTSPPHSPPIQTPMAISKHPTPSGLGPAATSTSSPRATPGAGRVTPPPIPPPIPASSPKEKAPTPSQRPPKAERARTMGYGAADASRTDVDAPSVSISIAPSESMSKAAERPLATQPGVASLQVERAKGTAAEIERQLSLLRSERNRKRGDDARIARLLLEDGLAWERAGDPTRAAELFDEAMKKGPELLPAVHAARRLLWGLREGEGGARPRITMPFVKTDATGGPTLASVLNLLDHEARLATKENERADLLVERARMLEAQQPRDHLSILEAYRNALTLRPSHAEALKGLEAALTGARAALTGDESKKVEVELATHYGRLAAAYGSDKELVASYLASRALLLEKQGDAVAAEEAYASAIVADGRVGPVREAYKRLLAKRGAYARLRDVLAEEAGREHDMARSVRLLYEAARLSLERLADAAQAITLLDHAASRAPTDPSIDVRVLDELTRLLESRGDATGAAVARRARIAHETDPAIRAIEYRRLAQNHEDAAAPEQAIHALEEARGLEPLHVPTQLALDRLYKKQDKHRERVTLWLDEAAKARESSRRAAGYVRAAHVAEDDLGAPDEALEYLRAAWVTDTSNVDAFDELTRLLLPPTEVRHGVGGGEGRSARALIELFTQAAQVATEPARRIAYLEKVAALWEDALGDPAHAAEVYARVLTLDPSRRFALLAMQRAYERSGDFRGLAAAVETEAEQAIDPSHAASLRLRAAEIWSSRVGDHQRSIGLVRRVLEAQSDHAAALRALLKAQEAAGRPEEVVDTLKKMIALVKSTQQATEALPLWLEVGEIYRHRLGRLDDAIAAWRAALAIDATHPVATRELAHALRGRGSWRAVAELEEAIGTAAKDPASAGLAWVRAAEVWEGRLDEDERAQKAYAKALEIRSDDLSAWEGLARLAERRGALHELEAAYQLRIDGEEGSTRLALRIALGELLVRRGDDPNGAASALEAVLAEAPTHIHALRLVEAIYQRTGNDSALARVLTMTAQAVKDPLAKRGVLWELVRLQEGRVSSSPPIAAFLLIYELDPTDEAAMAGIVRLATMRLRDDLIVTRDERVSDGLPNVRGLLAFGLRRQVAMSTDAATKTSLELRLADLLEDSIDRKEIGEALALYRSALSRDMESPTACAGVRRVAATLGDVAAQFEGESIAAEVAVDPVAKVAHLLRAAELARKGGVAEAEDDRAIALSAKALSVDPDSVEAAQVVSQLLLAKHDARRLVDLFMEAASAAKSTERIVALSREGARIAHTQLGNLPVAIAMLMQAREASRHDPDVLVELGDLYVGQHAWAEAAKAYRDVTEGKAHPPASVLVHAHKALASLYEGPLDDGEKALDELSKVAKLTPEDTAVQRKLAALLFEQGDWAAAEQSLEALVASRSLSRPEQCDVLMQLSELRLVQGDKRGAEHALREALKLDPDLSHDAFARLEAFHGKHGTGDAGVAAALSELVAQDPKADPRWLVRLGQLEVHRLGRPNEGLAHLRQAIAITPHDGDAVLSFGEGLLAIGANDEAARAMRELILREPTNGGALDAAARAYAAVGRRDETTVIEELRAYCGFTPDGATLRARKLPNTPPREETLEDIVIYSHVMPSAAKVPALEVLTSLADQLGKVLPPDLAAIGLSTRDRLTSRSTHPFRAMVDRAAHALGVGDVDLYVHDAADQRILVENFETPSLVVPSSLKALPELEIAFAIGRLVAKVASRTYLVDKLRPAELEELLVAAVSPYGGPMPRARQYEIEELSRKIQKAISRKARRQLEEIAPRVSQIDPVRLARAVDQGAIRTAYLLTGDLTSALDHLRRYEEISVADLGRPDTTTGDLIRFSLGSDASTLRRRLGTTWAP